MKNLLLLFAACLMLSFDEIQEVYTTSQENIETVETAAAYSANSTVDLELVGIIVVGILVTVFFVNFVFSRLENRVR